MHTANVRVHWAALMVAVTNAGMMDALEALWEWGAEYLDVDDEQREQLEEDLDLDENAPMP